MAIAAQQRVWRWRGADGAVEFHGAGFWHRIRSTRDPPGRNRNGNLLRGGDRVHRDRLRLFVQRSYDRHLLGGELRRRLLVAQRVGVLAVVQGVFSAHAFYAFDHAFRVVAHLHGLVVGIAHAVGDGAGQCLLVGREHQGRRSDRYHNRLFHGTLPFFRPNRGNASSNAATSPKLVSTPP